MDAVSIGLVAAFTAGVVSFLSPCVLPIVPGYVSYIAGESLQRRRHLHASERLFALGMSAFFVAGFSTVFIAFGASASAIGQLLLRYRYEANLVAGALVLAFGLFMLGAWRWLPWLQRDLRPHLASCRRQSARRLSARHGVRVRLDAVHRAGARRDSRGECHRGTSAGGVGLLSAYALGLGVPFLAAALLADRAAHAARAHARFRCRHADRRWSRAGRASALQ